MFQVRKVSEARLVQARECDPTVEFERCQSIRDGQGREPQFIIPVEVRDLKCVQVAQYSIIGEARYVH